MDDSDEILALRNFGTCQSSVNFRIRSVKPSRTNFCSMIVLEHSMMSAQCYTFPTTNVNNHDNELHLFPPSAGPRRHVDTTRQYGSYTSLGELPLDPQVNSSVQGANSHIICKIVVIF